MAMAIAPVASRDSSSLLRLRAFFLGEARGSRGTAGPAGLAGIANDQAPGGPAPIDVSASGSMAEAAAKPPIEASRGAPALPADILDRRPASAFLERLSSRDAGPAAENGDRQAGAWAFGTSADDDAGPAAAKPAGRGAEEAAASAPGGAGSLAEERASEEQFAEKRAASKESGRPSERELLDRLAGLEAEKAGGRRKRASGQAARSAAVQQAIAALKARDGEVRAHEGAHIAAGGRYVTGGASYSYQKGPDGRQYAIGGEVGIDSAPLAGKPEETAAKMRIVRAAALAPAEPSGADHAVAAAASQAEAAAFAEIAAARREDAASAYASERDAFPPKKAGEAPGAPRPGGEASPGAGLALWA